MLTVYQYYNNSIVDIEACPLQDDEEYTEDEESGSEEYTDEEGSEVSEEGSEEYEEDDAEESSTEEGSEEGEEESEYDDEDPNFPESGFPELDNNALIFQTLNYSFLVI